MAINIDEKILFQRGGKSQNGNSNKFTNPYLTKPDDLKREEDLGVLVIDPNKVVNKYNEVVDRYVKQEDLVMYATLKVYKKAESAVVYKSDGSKINENTSEPIYINFLNPLSNRKRSDGTIVPKGKMTTQWSDFFTSDAANDKSSSQYVLDPETFGITNISVKINASHLPIITIEFTDIQGRTLFERGNEKDNPYNIFYTYPYPKFSLLYKGYYGKTMENQIVLTKSNTRFDPSSGNYTVTAEFTGEVYALFNTFLLIYGYVAPYMFRTNDGKYLGRKILNELYDRQNNIIQQQNPENYDDYKITSYPTLHDLAGAIKKIPYKLTSSNGDTTLASNEKLLANKILIENYETSVRDYISNSPDSYRTADNAPVDANTNSTTRVVIYEPIVSDKIIKTDVKTPADLNTFLTRINESVKELTTIEVPNFNFKTEVESQITNNNNTEIKNYIGNKKITTDQIFDLSVFQYKGQTTTQNPVYLDAFNTIIAILFNNIAKLERILEEDYVTDQVRDIGEVLGYRPNLTNIIRIICNNMQTFLILLEITGKSAIRQLTVDRTRLNIQKRSSDYQEKQKLPYFSPFPNYYKTTPANISGKQIDRLSLTYPGTENINKSWFEVQFVEEIYEALKRVKESETPSTKGFFNQVKTGVLTLFQLSEPDLSVYRSKEYSKILAESYSKYSIFMSYSGLLFRGIQNSSSEIAGNIGNFEYKLMAMNVFDKIDSNEQKWVIRNEIKRATETANENGVNYTNVGNFGIRYIGFGQKTVSDATTKLTPVLNELGKYSEGSYTQSNYEGTISKLTKLINDNIIDKSIYDTITFKKSENDINLFSVNADKKGVALKHFIDLKSSMTYYCDISNELGNFSEAAKTIVDGKSDTNPYQGLYRNMNDKLKLITIPTDFSRGTNFADLDNVPSLTFNTQSSDFAALESMAGYVKVTSTSEKKYHKLFNI
jgi:hypothetical protein